MSKQALGKGLGALIPAGPAAGEAGAERGVLEVELSRISPNALQPRKSFREDALAELAHSIKQKGVIQPVILRRKPAGGYELIAGERRFRASLMAGLKKIPAIVKDVSPSEVLELALIENIQREDLNPIETAQACGRLIKDFGLTQDEMASRVGKDRSTMTNLLRLLTLPSEVKRDIAEGRLSMGHAKAILSLEGAQRQLALRREIVTRGLSVREAEAHARRLKGPGRIVRKKPAASAQIALLEDDLKRSLGTKVRLRPKGKGGTIEIAFYSTDEFQRLYDRLMKK